MTSYRRSIYFNPDALSWRAETSRQIAGIEAFHKQIQGYQPSPLVSLEKLAKEIGVKAVYAKDESNRLGLHSAHILGVSWAVSRAVAKRLGLLEDEGFEAIKSRLAEAEKPVSLHAASAGNHGRAVSRFGALIGASVTIYAPVDASDEAINLIRAEGATVVQVKGSYSEASLQALTVSQDVGGILIPEDYAPGIDDEHEVR